MAGHNYRQLILDTSRPRGPGAGGYVICLQLVMPEVFLPVKKPGFLPVKKPLYFLPVFLPVNLPVFLPVKKHFSICNINSVNKIQCTL